LSEDGWIKLAEIAAGCIASLVGVAKAILVMWLNAKKSETEHRYALEAENEKLKKENITIGFQQLKEADQWIRGALLGTAKQLKETTLTVNLLAVDVKEMSNSFKETQTLAALKIQEATARIEALEDKIRSTVTPVGEGKVRVSTNKPFKE
jgi:hypothetical protein